MTLRVVKVIDPRLETQADPVFTSTIGPRERQFYYLPASAKGDDYIGFTNIVTRGTYFDYLNTFATIIRATITLRLRNTGSAEALLPEPNSFTFRDFPLNRCCQQIRVNLNGMAFYSSPMYDIDYKQQYWDERELVESYANVCPCNKPWMATESDYTMDGALDKRPFPYRLMNGEQHYGYAAYSTGPGGTCNNSILPYFNSFRVSVAPGETATVNVPVEWVEPIFCTPFASRYDQTIGKALYNISSLEIAMNLRGLKNMLRTSKDSITDYEIHINTATLRYEVLTVPPDFPIPDYTVTPYRKIDTFVTDYPANPVPVSSDGEAVPLSITSGVYTFNEIPQAIIPFITVTRDLIETSPPDGWAPRTSFGWNKLALPITGISISMSNTTQILETADVLDLYRIAKRNGFKASFESFARPWMFDQVTGTNKHTGVGSYLRLIPGTDIILPDQQLVPGANADNMVFQITVKFLVPPTLPPAYRNLALWLLFEKVGVARWNNTTGTSTMNPLADGSAMASAPVVSTTELPDTSKGDASATEGSGWLDKIKNIFSKVNNWARNTGVVSKTLGMIPQTQGLASAARSLGYGSGPFAAKRPRVSGGAVMGLGDFV